MQESVSYDSMDIKILGSVLIDVAREGGELLVVAVSHSPDTILRCNPAIIFTELDDALLILDPERALPCNGSDRRPDLEAAVTWSLRGRTAWESAERIRRGPGSMRAQPARLLQSGKGMPLDRGRRGIAIAEEGASRLPVAEQVSGERGDGHQVAAFVARGCQESTVLGILDELSGVRARRRENSLAEILH